MRILDGSFWETSVRSTVGSFSINADGGFISIVRDRTSGGGVRLCAEGGSPGSVVVVDCLFILLASRTLWG